MKFRKLRIAWSIACCIACVLLIVLWVRSRYRRDSIEGPVTAATSFVIDHVRGRVSVGVYRFPSK